MLNKINDLAKALESIKADLDKIKKEQVGTNANIDQVSVKLSSLSDRFQQFVESSSPVNENFNKVFTFIFIFFFFTLII